MEAIDRPLPLKEVSPTPSAESRIQDEEESFWSEGLRYVFLVRQHLILFLIAAVVVTSIVVIWGLSQQKTYRATTTVLVNYSPPKVLGQSNEVYQMTHHVWEYNRYFETQPKVITSSEVLQEVVFALSLDEDDVFMGLAAVEDPSERDELRTQIDPVAILRGRITIDAIRDSLALNIRVTDPDPDRAAMIANEVARAYEDYYRNVSQSVTSSAGLWLKERVSTLEAQVNSAEDNIVEFRRTNNFLGTSLEDSLNLANERLLTINQALTEAELTVLEMENRYDKAVAMEAEGNRDSIPAVLESSTINELKVQLIEVSAEEAKLRARYGEKNPRLLRIESERESLQLSLDREISSILASMEADLSSARENRRKLGIELDSQRAAALDLRERETEFHRLDRDLQQTESLYSDLNNRSLHTELAGTLQNSNVSILDRAMPPKRAYRPNRKLVMLMALMLGIAAAFALVIVVDRLDITIRSHEQLEAEFKIPVLGIQPRFDDASRGQQEDGRLRIDADPRGALAESCRTLRTNLMFLAPNKGVFKVLVTSAGPSEGKTSLAANLAYTMASSGKRVILIDTDMRRPRVHKVFGMEREVGLTSILIGEMDLDQAVRPSGYANLDLLPLANVPPNPAELLESSTFTQLVEQLEARYDRIIFDSPPIMAVTDASILTKYVDGTLVVARQDKTNRHMLRQSITAVQTVNARVLGFVLNDVDLNSAGRGYYSYRYRYPYYHYTYRYHSRYAEDEDEGERADQTS